MTAGALPRVVLRIATRGVASASVTVRGVAYVPAAGENVGVAAVISVSLVRDLPAGMHAGGPDILIEPLETLSPLVVSLRQCTTLPPSRGTTVQKHLAHRSAILFERMAEKCVTP